MKLNSTLRKGNSYVIVFLMLLFVTFKTSAQVTTVCTDPNTYIYGLTGNGMIYEVNMNTAVTGTVVKDNTYSGNSPSSANGLGYNYINGKFYYFKRNVTSSPEEFVSFNPSTNTVTVLATSTNTADIHTGCVSSSGTGYYVIDVNGTMSYYNITLNTWTFITSVIKDQDGNDVSSIIKSQNAGDMAIDGWGNIWLVTASNSNYGLYKFPANLPTTPQASFTVTRVIDPSASTPTGQSFAGIAFNPTGQIYMATKSGNRLYRLENNLSLTFIGSFTTSDVGNDLTSCSFPYKILPVLWKNFNVTVQKSNTVNLSWDVFEQNSKGFYIQHSLDGNTWEDISYVKSKNDPKTISSYVYTYINNLNGKQYYRLKQLDPNGNETYSDVRVITLHNENKSVSVWPNPAKDHIQLINDGDNGNTFIKAQVYDLTGKLLLENKLQQGVNTINVNTLRTGTFILRLIPANGIAYNEKIIKQ
ncbi:MAG: T9SS type A sorting domain-containing protein [Terrimonas sp.]|nr:T9SS type A sorting domain-containing protein [Terrimonas sp.]